MKKTLLGVLLLLLPVLAQVSQIPSGSGSASSISGSTTNTPGTIYDGCYSSTISVTVTGAVDGDTAIVSASSALPTGVFPVDIRCTTNSCTFRLLNMSGSDGVLYQTVGSTTFTIRVVR